MRLVEACVVSRSRGDKVWCLLVRMHASRRRTSRVCWLRGSIPRPGESFLCPIHPSVTRSGVFFASLGRLRRRSLRRNRGLRLLSLLARSVRVDLYGCHERPLLLTCCPEIPLPGQLRWRAKAVASLRVPGHVQPVGFGTRNDAT